MNPILKLVAIVAVIACNSHANAQVPLSYRGLSIGDSLENAQVAAGPLIGELKKLSGGGLGGYVLTGGKGPESMLFCNWNRRSYPGLHDCSRLFLRFTHESLGQTLCSIRLVDWYAVPLDLGVIVSRLKATYGEPRLQSHFVASEAEYTSFVWGGDNSPGGDFGKRGADDFSRLKGKFVAVSMFHQGNNLTGYSLEIEDRDASGKSTSVEYDEYKQEKNKGMRPRSESLNF